MMASVQPTGDGNTVQNGEVLPLTAIRSGGTALSTDSANNAVLSNESNNYHVVWNVNAAEEPNSAAVGDIVISLESLAGEAYGYSSANTAAAGGNAVPVSGSAYVEIPAGTELVLRNRSGRAIVLRAAATPGGNYAGAVTTVKV